MIAFLLLAQSTTAMPDLELHVRAKAKSVRIEQKGTSYLRLTTMPDAGNVVTVATPPIDTQADNVAVAVDAEARIGDPAVPPAPTLPPSSPPPPR